MTHDEIEKTLREELPLWQYDKEEKYIKREINTSNFKETMLIINLIAGISESHFHHPDVEFGYKKIILKLKTHSENAVTEKDINLAKDIDKFLKPILERSAKK